LFVMNIANGSENRLRTNLSGYCAEATWNPCYPHLIAFTAACGKTFQLGIYDMNTCQARFLTKGGPGVDNLEATWLRDGRHLIFTKRKAKSCQLFILDTWTGKETPLSSNGLGSVSQADVVYLP
ncbi:MAG TPA: biopolymer transporter Tol, partial [Opitutales bacterium]|nr:biopolymer transporter Tol [Opitutales bacterium]